MTHFDFEKKLRMSQNDYIKLRDKVPEKLLGKYIRAFHSKIAKNCQKIINDIMEEYESNIRKGLSYQERVDKLNKQKERIKSHTEAGKKHLEMSDKICDIPEYEFWLTEKSQMQMLMNNPFLFICIDLLGGERFYAKN